MTAPEKFLHPLMDPPEERIGLDGIWRIVRRRLMLILMVTSLTIGLAYLVVSGLEPEYRTRSTVVMTTLDIRVNSSDVALETFELNRSIVETELNILRSREFAYTVVQAIQADQYPAFAGVQDPASTETPEERRERLIDKMLVSYSVFRDGESLAVQILAVSSDPILAARIANGVAETYILENTLKRRQSIERSINFLRERVQQLGEELSRTELDLAAFIRANELDDTDQPVQLRADVDRLTATLAALRADPNTSNQDQITRIAEQLERTEAALHDRTRAELALLRRERSMELLRIRYQGSIERLNEMETQIDFIAQGAQQVSIARVPSEASSPNLRVSLAVSGLVGLVLAFVAALALESLNTRVWNEAQSRRITSLPNFGYIPQISRQGVLRRRYQPIRYMMAHPYSAFSEALRGFLTIWFNFTKDGRIVMITSGLPGEGKSTVAVSLSAAAAQDGMRVLLLDLDSHRQGASALLDTKPMTATLQQAVRGEVEPKRVISQGSERGSVDLLCMKVRDKRPPKEFKADLEKLRKLVDDQYDIVFVDTPPVLILDEACRLNTLVDNTLIVARWGQTTEQVLRDTFDRLTRNGMPVAGTLINNVDLRKHRNYGYGGYGHYYGSKAYNYV